MLSFNHKKWSIFFVLPIFFNSCFGLQIRNSELDIKKKNEPNGYLKIVFKGDMGYYTPFLKINLREKYPDSKKRLPIIFSEDLGTVYSLDGRIEENEILIPIKQGEYFASIVNEELYTTGAVFVFPLLFREDKYIGISFGLGEEFNSVDSVKASTKCISSQESRNYLISFLLTPSDILFNRCPKLKIKANQTTEVYITFSEEEIRGWRSFFGVVPGALLGIPLFGTLVYKSNSTAEIKYPDETKPVAIKDKK